jgi:hypothetical protein
VINVKVDYIWERIYPHVIAVVATVILVIIKFNPLESAKIDALVDGIVTLDSIIIGFIGAVIPVILSMKNESKLVKYVFERDSDGLFKKYISETIGYGLFDICISLTIYTKDIILNRYVKYGLSLIFLYSFFVFILSTYRSMTCMLKLIFSSDDSIEESLSNKLSENESAQLWKEKGR